MKGCLGYKATEDDLEPCSTLEVRSESAGFPATGTDRTPTCPGHPSLLSGISLNTFPILEKTTVKPHGVPKSSSLGSQLWQLYQRGLNSGNTTG